MNSSNSNLPKLIVPKAKSVEQWSGYKYNKGKGHPPLFSFSEAEHFDAFPDSGGYPKGFLKRAFTIMGVYNPSEVLHVCSGSVKSGTTVDIRNNFKPTVIADARHLPFLNETFEHILIDPPYTLEYASNLYRTGNNFPTPNALIKSASRVLKIGGKIGMLHFIVPIAKKPMMIRSVHGITTGSGYAIRAFTVLEKLSDFMWDFRRQI